MSRDAVFRRAQRLRIRAKRLRDMPWLRTLDEAEIGVHIDTPKRCSCLFCGNPRRHFGIKTVQERRADGSIQRLH